MSPLRLDLAGFTVFREPTTVDFTDADFFALVGPDRLGQVHGARRDLLRAVRHGAALGRPRGDRQRARAVGDRGPGAAGLRVGRRPVRGSPGWCAATARATSPPGSAGLEALPPGFDLTPASTPAMSRGRPRRGARRHAGRDGRGGGRGGRAAVRAVHQVRGAAAGRVRRVPARQAGRAAADPGQPARACDVYGQVRERAVAPARPRPTPQLQRRRPAARRATPTPTTTALRAAVERVGRKPSSRGRDRPGATAARRRAARGDGGPRGSDRAGRRDRAARRPCAARARSTAWPRRRRDARTAVADAAGRGHRGRGARGEAARRAGRGRRPGGAAAAAATRTPSGRRLARQADGAGQAAGGGRRRSTGRRRPRSRRPGPARRRRRRAGGRRARRTRRRRPLDRAGALRPHLRAGEPCPVCEQHGGGAAGRPARGSAAEAAKAAGVAARRRADAAGGDGRAARRRAARARPGPGRRAGPGRRSSPPGWPTWTASWPARPSRRRCKRALADARREAQGAGRRRRRGAHGPRRRRARGGVRGRDGGGGGPARPGATSTRPATGWRRSARRRPTATTSPAPGRRWPAGRADAGAPSGSPRARPARPRWRGPTRRSPRRRAGIVALFADAGLAAPAGDRLRAGGGGRGGAGRGGAAPGRGAAAEAARLRAAAGRARAGRRRSPRRWPATCGPTTSSGGCWTRRWTLLVDGASRILRELTGGQYDLVHDKGEFFVVDHHDAGLRRAVRTLSGGETFQASLALALALSEQLAGMSTGAASLESIVLDEGFGTLDAATLDTVAATLENLAARGDRMVGVVTHVRGAGRADPGAVRGAQGRAHGPGGTGVGMTERSGHATELFVDAWDPSYGAGVRGRRVRGRAGRAEQRPGRLPTSRCRPPRGRRCRRRPTSGRPTWCCWSTACAASTPGLWIGDDAGRRTRGWRPRSRPGWCAATCGAARPRWRSRGWSAALFTAARRRPTVDTGAGRYPVLTGAQRRLPASCRRRCSSSCRRWSRRCSRQSRDESTADELLVADGPLRGRAGVSRALGYIKSHEKTYLPPALSAVVAALRAGQRTPVFLLGTPVAAVHLVPAPARPERRAVGRPRAHRVLGRAAGRRPRSRWPTCRW